MHIINSWEVLGIVQKTCKLHWAIASIFIMKGKLMIQYESHSVGTSELLSLLLFSSIKTINTLDVVATFIVSNLFMWIKVKGKEKMGSSCQI